MRHRMISIGDYAVENDRGDRGDLFEGGSGREMCRLRVQRDHTVLPMELLSVNVGKPRPNPWKGLSATRIDKRPVGGPVAVIPRP